MADRLHNHSKNLKVYRSSFADYGSKTHSSHALQNSHLIAAQSRYRRIKPIDAEYCIKGAYNRGSQN
ncbi:hypothetical protein PPACK8108_LOCUS16862 [Phakopsora pachyrhizi]|uniref:Uncharacterized protein n=1 Tax=Phakopsora pachyrhizi TaxID=170000 RepID=A0AAV0BC32_PHAPC|nr:hypothetical protein PPACK8108_LOCUS16862 [Phakopsora pachyrhizi]